MYTTKSGDTWDVIAKEVYGSEYHADVLMAANPQEIDTFIFNAGVELNTPALEEERDIRQAKIAFQEDMSEENEARWQNMRKRPGTPDS